VSVALEWRNSPLATRIPSTAARIMDQLVRVVTVLWPATVASEATAYVPEILPAIDDSMTANRTVSAATVRSRP
jgi:hypothetical protein